MFFFVKKYMNLHCFHFHYLVYGVFREKRPWEIIVLEEEGKQTRIQSTSISQ